MSSPTPTPGLDRLTERERDYLRQVHEGASSKMIALRHGVEPRTVDKAIEFAKAKLGTSSRHAAARLVAESKAWEKLPPQPQPLAASADRVIMGPFDTEPAPAADLLLREQQEPYRATMPRGLRVPLRRMGGRGNDLTAVQMVGWILAIAACVPVLLGSLMVGLWALGQIAAAIKHSLI